MTRRKTPSRVEKADIKVARAAGPVRRNLLTRIAGELSEVADQPPMRAIAAATIAAGAIGQDRRLTLVGMRMLAAHQLATSVKSVIKQGVDRTRPEVLLDGGTYESGEGRHDESRFSSFPSGHAAGAFAVARAIGRDYPAAAIAALVAAAGVAAVQVPRGKHYISDVLAGAVIGIAVEAGLDALARRLRR